MLCLALSMVDTFVNGISDSLFVLILDLGEIS